MKREIVKAEDGQPMMVIRPKNAALALQIASVAAQQQDTDLFERLPELVDNYTFRGFLARRRNGSCCIVDKDGRFVEELKPGDSMVTEKSEAAGGERPLDGPGVRA